MSKFGDKFGHLFMLPFVLINNRFQ